MTQAAPSSGEDPGAAPGLGAPVRLLYFAWLRERIGKSEETVLLPDRVRDVGALLDWLAGREPAVGEALAAGRVLRAAVNQSLGTRATPIGPGDEVALFPPITGG